MESGSDEYEVEEVHGSIIENKGQIVQHWRRPMSVGGTTELVDDGWGFT